MDTRIVDSHPAAARLETLGIRYLFKPESSALQPQQEPVPGADTRPPSCYVHPHSNDATGFQTDPLLEPLYRPSYSVWTYLELYEDLFCGFNTPRARLLTAIQNSMGWDACSFTYWPVTRNFSDKTVPDKDFFYSAMDRINPVYIFCFGAAAFNILFPRERFAYGKWVTGHFSIMALPSIDALMPDNRLLKNFTWRMINSLSLS
ncbi:conserved hypothetical protein [Desulfonatronospira thiodismutans ASO3-1]|uniref:Uracil-DNA glycosylase-like domain-containing protein n=2 Tax=Desulfonatronospira thiodismutans TaxID=488939 RepID=D6SP87_9BACT|nr:conserved hypothetical protein [Desulfonatronospira thiodismutans ASO3-1]